MTMRKLILTALLIGFGSIASAQTITCAVSGATGKQTTLYAAFLARVNAERAAHTPALPPFANFSEHCGFVMLSAFQSYVAQQAQVDADKVATAVKSNGDAVALTAHCTAVGLGAGCLKAQVACFVLTGNTACN
jgi:hypothetical protein